MDTLRPDRLSCYGYTGHETPSIDRLAESGVMFRRAHSVASWTTPSMGAILTSRYPTQLGLVEAPADEGHRFEWRERRDQTGTGLPPSATTLAEILRQAGFRTAAFVDQPALNVDPSFARGFEDWYYPQTPKNVVRREASGAGDTPRDEPWPPYLWNAPHIDSLLVGELDRWLETRSGEKLFVWLHLLTPHWPYAPTREAAIALARGEADIPAFYDGEVRIVDDLVADVVRSIREHVGEERSVLVFTSDHGEALGERGMFEHGHTLHREVVQVPLILAGGGLPSGRVVEAHVRTVDILPTIVELAGAGAELPAGVAGTNLLADAADDGRDRPVYSEAMLYGSTERSLVAGRHKVMYDAQEDGWELYDLARDPLEERDIADAEPDRLDDMRRSLIDIHEALAAERDSSGIPVDRERLLEAMNSLGYVGR